MHSNVYFFVENNSKFAERMFSTFKKAKYKFLMTETFYELVMGINQLKNEVLLAQKMYRALHHVALRLNLASTY